MRVAVTGANGYIGRHVVDGLLRENVDAIAIDIVTNMINPKAIIIQKDIFKSDKNFYSEIGSPDVFIHLAWRDGFIHNSSVHMLDLSSHYRLIENILSCGLKQLVVMGTMHEVGYYEGMISEETLCNPISMYGIAKDALRKSTIQLTNKYKTILQWLRAYYIYGDDKHNHSVFTKIVEAEENKVSLFPFTTGENKYDFIHIDDLCEMIIKTALQINITGIIECCTGKPISLSEKIETFIRENKYKIKLDYGKYPSRPYDSPAVWGNPTKIESILNH